jgi:hypothetical protein
VEHGVANKRRGNAIGLTRDRLVAVDRAAVAAQRRRGNGNSNGGEDRGGAQQCVAPGASMRSREDAGQVTGRGETAEGRARRWRSGGGRGSSGSGE